MFSVLKNIRFILIYFSILIWGIFLSFPIHAETMNGHVDVQIVSLSDVGYVGDFINGGNNKDISIMDWMRNRSVFVYEEKTTLPRERHVVIIASY